MHHRMSEVSIDYFTYLGEIGSRELSSHMMSWDRDTVSRGVLRPNNAGSARRRVPRPLETAIQFVSGGQSWFRDPRTWSRGGGTYTLSRGSLRVGLMGRPELGSKPPRVCLGAPTAGLEAPSPSKVGLGPPKIFNCIAC